MRIIYRNGIPHWTDGVLALPVMAGAQEVPDWLTGILGGGTEEPPDPEETPELSLWANREFFDPMKGTYGRLRWADQPPRSYRDTETGRTVRDPGGRKYWLVSQAGTQSAIRPGDSLLDTTSLRVLNLGTDPKTSRVTIVASKYASQDDLARWGLVPAGDGTPQRNYAAEQAAADAAQRQREQEQRAWQEEQNRLNREFEAEQARIRAEEERRQRLMGTATQLLEGRRQSRDVALGRASELAGQDIFKFLANIKGKTVAEGTMTPIDVFKAQNAQIATAQAPTIAPNASIGDLESAITKMTQMQQQEEQVGSPGPFVGFAGGGMLGAGPAQFGTTKTAVLVGDGTINGDEEVLIHDRATGQAEVIPLSGGAETGATLPANLTVLPQLFETLRQNVTGVEGLGQFRAGMDPRDYLTRSRSALGYLQPGAQTGPATLGSRGALATPLSIKQGLIESTRYTPEQAQQLSNLIGTLPAPHKAAKFLRGLLPSEASAVISAYKLAGFPTQDLEALLNESVISGPQRTGVSLR